MKIKHGPLKCWDIYAMHLSNQAKLYNVQSDIDNLLLFQEKYGWTLDLSNIITENEFDALVLTNLNKEITWINKGFSKMTGYPMNFSLGKKPKFLQGQETSKASLEHIQEKLKSGMPFDATLINYRKDGSPYKCEIKFYPLRNVKNMISHYLALEKEV